MSAIWFWFARELVEFVSALLVIIGLLVTVLICIAVGEVREAKRRKL